ncbi:MAG TPA: hypothetical protein GX390_01270 [Acholeplasmataceae bacterium]|jgi:uncharacterized membrane protein YwzB|nr:hypothetical protein [Acholeplasmataceae bacterium]
MFSKLLTMWFLFIIIILVPVIYRALMALRFSSLFNRASTWQIKFLMALISFILAFLAAFAFVFIIERIVSVI